MDSQPAEAVTPNEALTPTTAAAVMGDLGFLVVPGVPGRDSTAYLIVAIRPGPTLAHYDPESVLYWTPGGAHDLPAIVDRSTPLPLEGPFSWGPVRITDRLGVSNEFLTFGGRLAAAQVDGARIVLFSTPGPMIRRGGHSQGWDPGSAHLAAWFARLRALLGQDAALDARVTAMSPLARYSAYLAGSLEGFAETPALSRDRHAELGHLRTEAVRRRRDQPAEWAAGQRLLVTGAIRPEPHPVSVA
jgi:hypothetical protein